MPGTPAPSGSPRPAAPGSHAGLDGTPLPVVYLVSTVLFPGGTASAQLRTRRNLLQISGNPDDDAVFLFVFAPGMDPEKVEADHTAPIGVTGRVVSRLRLPDGSFQIAMQGMRRARVSKWTGTDPVLQAVPAEASEERGRPEVIDQHVFGILNEVEALIRLDDAYSAEHLRLLQSNVDDPGRFADLVAQTVAFDLRERLAVLEELSVERRLEVVSEFLRGKVEFARIAREIEQRASSDIGKAQREYFLRQQMKAIRTELGDESREEADAKRFTQRADEAALPPEADKAARAEIERLRNTNPASAEYAVILNYLDWIVSIPWKTESVDRADPALVKKALDEDHDGLEKPKERILEFLAVRARAPKAPGPVLCFAGPPGTGKTSLAQSVARAMGRKLVRISVGGVHDESQIRGHRRTYVGALPGRIVEALRRAGTRNPVLVVDEVDKMTSGPQGDPAAALLEVLDPEQNRAFTDHYLDLPVDLSRVLFIATANEAWEIPGPLLDRMEVVPLRGYTEAEKVSIAKRHLLRKALERTGTAGKLKISPAAIREIVRHRTREAGVRDLARRLEEIGRKHAVLLASGKRGPFSVGPKDLDRLLGPAPDHDPERRRRPEVGVATGLAWTGTGGDLLVIEGIRMPGQGGFALTGSLGEVMKESVQAAGSWVRAHCEALGVPKDAFSSTDVHVHFPQGAVPKDGPSAGVAVTLVLASLFTGWRIRHDVAFTGEVTLRGKVLPVGGLPEKLSAAARSGIREVVLPAANLQDLHEVPAEVRRKLKITGVDTVEEAMARALVAPAGAKKR
ncbi:MAG TPA: endopeptidase La, partial [Planctomycetota bacterium]|nr:endopeptidase La [Planctomycetota bacterium]